eukprot:scaffold5121_cov223-Ochromonas_danica.AAC.5
MSKPDEGELSYDNLLEYALDLEKQLEERDNQIADLTKGEVGKRRRGGESADATYYEQENRTLIAKIEEDTATIKKLRDDLASANVKVQGLLEEKAELDKRIRTQTKRIEDLERDNNSLMRKSQTVEERSKEMTKQKSENIKVAQQMAQENEVLRNENEQLTADFKALKAKHAELEEVLVKYAGEKELVEAHRDNLDVEKDQLRERVTELENDLLDMADKVQESIQAELQWEKRYQSAQEEVAKLQTATAAEVAQAKATASKLQQEIISLQDTTQAGKVQKQLEELSREQASNNAVIEELKAYLVETAEERDALVKQLDDIDGEIDQRVADKIAKERKRVQVLEATIQRLQAEQKANEEHYKAVDEEQRELVKTVDELTHWKTVYEAGHGLQQLARTERKLSDDLKRLQRAFEEQNLALGQERQSREVLHLAFERLKKECGKPADFSYPDLDLHMEVESNISQLNTQIDHLEKQLDYMEEENTRLRKSLRNTTAVMGDDGQIKFPGLDADMLVKINEFAANLREGKLELPLNDRSRALLEDNRKLKSEIQNLNQQLQRRESFSAAFAPGTDGVLSDVFGADMKTLLQENAGMHKKLSDLQQQLSYLMSQQEQNQSSPAALLKAAEEVARMLQEKNEAMLHEMEELRSAQNRAPAPTPLGGGSREVGGMNWPSGRAFGRSAPSPSPAAFSARSSPARSRYDPGTPMPSSTPYWTPRMGRGGMPFYVGTPGAPSAGPATPHGKQLLQNTLYNMHLPPEDWAVDVRELNTQLIECLEQLYEREEELSGQKQVLSDYEAHLADAKTQMIILYHDFAQQQREWQQKEKQLLDEHRQISFERDDMRLKLKRAEEMTSLLQRQDHEAIEWKMTDLQRKVVIYEVNESILSRKYISLSEQLDVESRKRQQLEVDFAEMEATLKQRILFLEQYKLAAGSRLALVQGQLDKSVPQEDYMVLQEEVQALREEHILTLRREVEARATALKSLDRARELRELRLVLHQYEEELEKARLQSLNLQAELQHQLEVTDKALLAVQASPEISKLISEVAKYRGEASRLEVELQGSLRRAGLMGEQVEEVMKEAEQLSARVKELEVREEEFVTREQSARKDLLDLKLQYEGGLTREEKDTLVLQQQKSEQALQHYEREMVRLKELAAIATQQAQTLSQARDNREEEMRELRDYCSRLESRSEDEILIGRLQRQLLAIKASYKAFSRKYHYAREDLRVKEIALRLIESRATEAEKSFHDRAVVRRKEVLALKKALEQVQETIIETRPGPSAAALALPAGAKNEGLLVPRGSRLVTSSLGNRVVEISSKVDTLEDLAQKAVAQAAQKDEECQRLLGQVEDLQAERSILQSRLQDLDALINGPASKQSAVAGRLVHLSEEVRAAKLASLKQRRQVTTMREESKHLRSLLAKMEAEMAELEKIKLQGEALAGSASSATLLSTHGVLQALGAEDPLEKELQRSLSQLSLISSPATVGQTAPPLELEPQTERIRELSSQLAASQREASAAILQAKGLNDNLRDLEGRLQEQEEALRYYEGVLSDHGLSKVLLRGKVPTPRHPATSGQGNNMSAVEQEKLQEAATATISSLRALLEEKNRLIEKYRDRIERLTTEGSDGRGGRGDRASRNADALLDRLADEDEEERDAAGRGNRRGNRVSSSPRRGENSTRNVELESLYAKSQESQKLLTRQLEVVEDGLREKERTIQQLETTLAQQIQQRERAEVRCGEALKEMEAMKIDMVTLAQQLQESEARCTHLARGVHPPPALPPVTTSAVVSENDNQGETTAPANRQAMRQLQRQLSAKEQKLQAYRTLIVRLKEEFVKAEQEKAAQAVSRAHQAQQQQQVPPGMMAISADEVRELRQKVADLFEGLKASREDLDKAKKMRDKVVLERNQAVEDLKKLHENHEKALQARTMAEQTVTRLRRDLEESRRKEARLREKMRELLDQQASDTAGGGAAGKGKKDLAVRAKERIDQLEREVEMLKAQNAAMRRGDAVERAVARTMPLPPNTAISSQQPATEEIEKESAGATIGQMLGSGGGGGTMDDVRQALHAKWETEKRLQKRIGVLEKRLQELVSENDSLRSDLQRQRERVQQHPEKGPEGTRSGSVAHHTPTRAAAVEKKALTVDEVMQLEEVQPHLI